MTQQLYRSYAAAQRRAAAEASLPNRRAMHERSAAVWEQMAQSAEDTAERAKINARAKGV